MEGQEQEGTKPQMTTYQMLLEKIKAVELANLESSPTCDPIEQ